MSDQAPGTKEYLAEMKEIRINNSSLNSNIGSAQLRSISMQSQMAEEDEAELDANQNMKDFEDIKYDERRSSENLKDS